MRVVYVLVTSCGTPRGVYSDSVHAAKDRELLQPRYSRPMRILELNVWTEPHYVKTLGHMIQETFPRGDE